LRIKEFFQVAIESENNLLISMVKDGFRLSQTFKNGNVVYVTTSLDKDRTWRSLDRLVSDIVRRGFNGRIFLDISPQMEIF